MTPKILLAFCKEKILTHIVHTNTISTKVSSMISRAILTNTGHNGESTTMTPSTKMNGTSTVFATWNSSRNNTEENTEKTKSSTLTSQLQSTLPKKHNTATKFTFNSKEELAQYLNIANPDTFYVACKAGYIFEVRLCFTVAEPGKE